MEVSVVDPPVEQENTEPPLSYQVFALSMQREGAIEYFFDHLPVAVVASEGKGHAEFYTALRDFYEKTGTDVVDRVAFRSWLQSETDIYTALGGSEGVKDYLDTVLGVELSNPQSVTAVLRHRYNKQRQGEVVNRLGELIKGPTQEEIIAEMNELAEEFRLLNEGVADPLDRLDDGNKIADRSDSIWDLPNFLPTQFPSLNRAMGYDENAGFCKGAVHAVLAASGKGKSTFAKNLMNHWVENGYSVLYVNYEETKEHWEKTLFTQLTKQNVYKGNNLSPLEKKHYREIFDQKMRDWNGRFLVNHSPDTAYYEDMEIWLRNIAARRGEAPDVIILDTIQSMFLKSSGKNLPRWGQYEIMMVRLEKLAKDLGSAIIITAQENSNRMKEKREVVQQSDIGGSLAIAQKSSITIFITDAKTETEQEDGVMQLQIPKNRITGVAFMMDPPLVRYHDETKSYIAYEPVDNSPYDADVILSDILNGDGGFH